MQTSPRRQRVACFPDEEYPMVTFHEHLCRARAGRRSASYRFQPMLESLEQRVVLYALSGYTWANPSVSVSFMPDGTLISSSYPSNLFAVYNAAYPQATWQREVARALQTWADVSNLNFHFVSDNGAPQGTPGLAQGDPHFGDIRIGGYNMGSGILGLGWNPGSTSTGGDVELNTASPLLIGTMPDLASVVMHEVGHGIGFNHSLVDPAVMEGGLWGTYPGPYADDIAGVQAMYGARKPDAYEGATGNGTLATAAPLTLSAGGVNIAADITTMGDVDDYKVVAPANSDGTLTVMVDASTISLLDPKVSVFNAAGTLLGTASATTYQGTATVKLTGLVAGQTYYLQAAGATTDVFGMGAYKLWAQFGPVPQPTVSINNVALLNGTSGTTAFTFTVSLSAASINPVTVQCTTADGTATIADGDYTPGSGSLTFAPGQTQQKFTVQVNGDAVAEPNEIFMVNLTSPTGAVLGTSQGTGTIEDGYIGPDAYEPDNTLATAHNFGTVSSLSQSGLTLNTATDVDYYRFAPGSRGTYVVSATPTQGSGTLGLTVYNASGTQLATGQLANATITLTVSLSANATYYIKVWSPTSSLLAYSVGMAGSSGGGKKLILAGWPVPAMQPPADVLYRNAADDPDHASNGPRSAASSTGTSAPAALPPLLGIQLNGAAFQPSQAQFILPSFGPQALPVTSAATAAIAVAVIPAAHAAPMALLDGMAAPPHSESSDGTVDDADGWSGASMPARRLTPAGEPVDTLGDTDASVAGVSSDLRVDVYSQMDGQASGFGALDAALALAVVLGSDRSLCEVMSATRSRPRRRT
jgi:hypothetical protein